MKKVLPLNRNFPLIVSFLWMMLSLMFVYFNQISDEVTHNLYVALCLISYGMCFSHWIKAGGKLLSFYIFFVGYCFFCNLGQSFLYMMGVPDFMLNVYTADDFHYIVDMLRFQLLCISALSLGTSLYLRKSHRMVTFDMQLESYKSGTHHRSKYDSILDVVMYGCMVYFLFECLNMIILRQSYDYMTFFEMGRGQTQNVLVSSMDFLVIILSVRSIYQKRNVNVIYFFYFAYIVSYMLVGSRGLSIRYVALTFSTMPFVYPNLFKKRFWAFWIVGFLFAFGFMSFISSTRGTKLGIASQYNETALNSLLLTFAEMGSSERPAVLTIEASEYAGSNYLTIPCTVMKGFLPFFSNLDFCKQNTIQLGDWISHYAGSDHSGLGYSCVAEAFVNFGWLGWLFFLFWGWFICFAENRANRELMRGNSILGLWLLAVLCTMVPYARSEFGRILSVLRWGEYLFVLSLLVNTGKPNLKQIHS